VGVIRSHRFVVAHHSLFRNISYDPSFLIKMTWLHDAVIFPFSRFYPSQGLGVPFRSMSDVRQLPLPL